MKLESLGRQTDLIFVNFSGKVIEHESFLTIKTPNNPEYHWGNYLIFSAPPQLGDLKKWELLFLSEFSDYPKPLKHRLFSWNGSEPECAALTEFTNAGYSLDTGVVFATTHVNPPPKYNNEIQIRPIVTDEDWQKVIELQILTRDPIYLENEYRQYKVKQFSNYKMMSQKKIGHWYGAFMGSLMVGNLGLFNEKNIFRFQSVSTHPNFRRLGICGTLVYTTAQQAIDSYPHAKLVMEADPEYHAAKIYESVGFVPVEKNHALHKPF